jgi:cysteine synthase B
LPRIFDPSRVDRVIEVSEKQATETTRQLANVEGIFAGMSSGGSTWAALQLANQLAAEGVTDALIVCIICDRGDRYLSSDLFG